MNNVQFDANDKYLIVNTETGKAIESQPDKAHADHACRNLNEHEARNGRPEVWVAREKAARVQP